MLLPVNAAMMDACVLAALEKGDTYGYRITQELAEEIGFHCFKNLMVYLCCCCIIQINQSIHSCLHFNLPFHYVMLP